MENSAQTSFRFSPVSFRAPRLGRLKGAWMVGAGAGAWGQELGGGGGGVMGGGGEAMPALMAMVQLKLKTQCSSPPQ